MPKLLRKKTPLSRNSAILLKQEANSSQRKKGALKRTPKLISAAKRKERIQTTCRGNITGPTRMYLERWGSLAPPLGKVSFPKICLLCFPPQRYSSTTVKGVQDWRAGVQACKKLSLFSTRQTRKLQVPWPIKDYPSPFLKNYY